MTAIDLIEEKTGSGYSTKEELKDKLEELSKLIEENKRLIQKYPDRFSLQIGLQSLETRKKELLREIVSIPRRKKKSHPEPNSVPVEKGETYDVTIQDIARLGDGIARIEGFVIFVPNTTVGDIVQIKVERVLSKFAFASINE